MRYGGLGGARPGGGVPSAHDRDKLLERRHNVLNLNDPAIRNDPYPLYAQLRRTSPVTRATVPMFGEAWLVTRYDDVVRGLKHPGLTNDARKTDSRMQRMNEAWWMPKALRAFQENMLSLDDPDHRRVRNLVHQAFTPRRIDQLTGDIDRIVDELLDRLAGK